MGQSDEREASSLSAEIDKMKCDKEMTKQEIGITCGNFLNI